MSLDKFIELFPLYSWYFYTIKVLDKFKELFLLYSFLKKINVSDKFKELCPLQQLILTALMS